MTARHFKDRIWDKFQKSKRETPSKTSHCLDSQQGKNQKSYITQLTETYPTMLHGLYRFATKLLRLDETSTKLAEAMNNRTRGLFPECPVRSNLKMNRNGFCEFSYKQGGN